MLAYLILRLKFKILTSSDPLEVMKWPLIVKQRPNFCFSKLKTCIIYFVLFQVVMISYIISKEVLKATVILVLGDKSVKRVIYDF